jgi:predicted transport protein
VPIFRIEDQKLRRLAVAPLDRERSLQRLLEANLAEALGLHFLASEYVTTLGGRIDTLAVDEAGCPVIIEYKKNRNDNIINQSLSYLKWLRTQKREFFEKLVSDKLGSVIADELRLDWMNPRVICIAESFSKFDIDTVEVVPLRIELFRYRFYADNVFSLEPVTVTEDVLSATNEVALSPAVARVQITAKPDASISALLTVASSETRALFDDFREWVMSLDEAVYEKPNTLYVAYKLTRNFAEVHVQKNALKIYLRPIDYDDPNSMIERIPDGYNWTLNRRIYVRNANELLRSLPLIEQSYRDVL